MPTAGTDRRRTHTALDVTIQAQILDLLARLQSDLGMALLLVTHDLSKSFGSVHALAGLTCAVHAGEIVGLLGPNGAGKTTTLKLLLGMLRPSAGRAEVLGLDVTRDALRTRAALGYTPDEPSFYDFLTGREVLETRRVVSLDKGSDDGIEMGDVVVTKHRYNAFHKTDLDTILRANGVRTIVVTGVSTNVCVESTVREGFMNDYYIVLVRDGTAAYSNEEHEMTVRNIDRFFGEISTIEELRGIWSGRNA